MVLYEWVRRRGNGLVDEGDTFRAWFWLQETTARAALRAKIDLLPQMKFLDAVQLKLVVGPVRERGKPAYRGIYKMKVSKELALRPMLMAGPGLDALTFLVGAVERGNVLEPSPAVALERAKEILGRGNRVYRHLELGTTTWPKMTSVIN